MFHVEEKKTYYFGGILPSQKYSACFSFVNQYQYASEAKWWDFSQDLILVCVIAEKT